MLATPPDTVPYFYGHISRDNAEHILFRHGCKDGMYLLRSSLNSDSDYVLSLCYNQQVRHYRITKDDLGMHCLDGYVNEKYNGPIELVENIKALPCKPVIPVIKPLHLFMPGVNCGITEEKLQAILKKKAREWGLEPDVVTNVAKAKDSEFWKLLLQCIHEVECWFHGRIPRTEAERRLTETSPENGKFLIRQRDECSFSLSLCYNGTVKHYKIDILSSGEVAIQDGPRFDNLISLVSHYSVFSNGLWCNLQSPCVNNYPQLKDSPNDPSNWPPPVRSWTTQNNDLNVVNTGASNGRPHLASQLNGTLTISPIAATRNGSISSLSSSSSSSVVQKPKNEMQAKGGSVKSSPFSWLKLPFTYSKVVSNESKSVVKLNNYKSREKKSSLPNLLATTESESLAPPARNLTPPHSLSSNDCQLNMLRMPPFPPTNLPVSSPSPSVLFYSKDQNDNDCKNNFPLIHNLPSPSSPPLDTVMDGPDSDDIEAESVRTFSEVPLPPSSFGRPLPMPRRKPPAIPRLNLSACASDEFTVISGSPRIFAKSIDPSTPTRLSPETPIEKLIPKLKSLISNPEITSPRNSELEYKVESDTSSDNALNETSRSKNSPPLSNAPKTFGIGKMAPPVPYIAELRNHRLMKSQDTVDAQPTNVTELPSAGSTSTSDLIRPKSTESQNTEINHEDSGENQTTSPRPRLGRLTSHKSHCEPQYEEIDPEYESNKDAAQSVGNSSEEETVSLSDGAQSSPDAEQTSLISSQVEEAKWDDTSEEVLPSGTSKPIQRRSPWTKEESEFHFKTIKRHRKGPCSIDRKKLSFQERLGYGNFGEVIKAIFKSGTDEVLCAVKTLRSSSVSTAREDILREAHIMTRLDHPHIVRLLGISEGDPFLLVMELASLGPLNIYLRKNVTFPVHDVLLLMYQVALGMEYLESKQFVHRDLAARNVLLVNETFAKISDFGMSKVIGLDSDYYRVEPKGKLPLKWYAPECIYFFRFSSKSDVWSYGITLWEALSYGDKPYLGMTGREILTMFSSDSRLCCPEKCPGEIYDIMWNCWQFRPEDRPSFSELVNVIKDYLNI